MTKTIHTVEGLQLKFTNLKKVFWPEEGYTKADLLNYYYQISKYLLPHLKERFMVMQRFPDGIYGKAFYQKECPVYAPDWIETEKVESPSSPRKFINYIICNNLATLLWLVNQGCIEMHPWLSKRSALDYPEAVIFDLDPNEEASFDDVLDVALLINQALASLKIQSYPKTSGATGLHIYIPIEQNYSYQEVRDFAESIAQLVVQAYPAKATIERTVSKRGSKIYIDYMQNVQGKTIASVFSARPLPGAPVSVPVSWDEIMRRDFSPQDFTIFNAPKLLEQGRLNFGEVLTQKQQLIKIKAW